MTQQNKELLLKDLSARLTYGVKCKLIYNNKTIKDEDATLFAVDKYGHFLFAEFGEDTREFVCKPYLFPFESMSEEATREFNATLEWITTADGYSESVMTYDSFDCLNKHYIDYRGLIPMGLAIDATDKNIY